MRLSAGAPSAVWAVQRFSAMIVDVPQVIFMLRRYTSTNNYFFSNNGTVIEISR